jgi:transposase-like protein
MRLIMRGLTDAEFERLYGTEDQCVDTLVAERRAVGVSCSRCGNDKTYFHRPRRRFGCTRCNERWSLTAGTVLADTKLPLRQWFRAMHLMTSTKQGISAVELGRRLGVRYPTAWYLHKRLRHAMTEREASHRIGGQPDGDQASQSQPTPTIVEADDVYLGGERNKGSGTAGKARVIAACERHGQTLMGRVALHVVDSFSGPAMRALRDLKLASGSQIHTDGLRCFNAFADPARAITHEAMITNSKRPGRQRSAPFFCVNTLVANLSTAIKATHKAISPKHLPDYLGAFAWTTNHRRNMTGMVHAACRAIANSTRLTRKGVYAAGAIGG